MRLDSVGNRSKVCEQYYQDQNRFMCVSMIQGHKLFHHARNRSHTIQRGRHKIRNSVIVYGDNKEINDMITIILTQQKEQNVCNNSNPIGSRSHTLSPTLDENGLGNPRSGNRYMLDHLWLAWMAMIACYSYSNGYCIVLQVNYARPCIFTPLTNSMSRLWLFAHGF